MFGLRSVCEEPVSCCPRSGSLPAETERNGTFSIAAPWHNIGNCARHTERRRWCRPGPFWAAPSGARGQNRRCRDIRRFCYRSAGCSAAVARAGASGAYRRKRSFPFGTRGEDRNREEEPNQAPCFLKTKLCHRRTHPLYSCDELPFDLGTAISCVTRPEPNKTRSELACPTTHRRTQTLRDPSSVPNTQFPS